jgi:hypothetical protein
MQEGVIPDGPKASGRRTAQSDIFNMACLEVTNTESSEQIKPLFLQIILDPFTRFEGQLARNHDYAS